MFGDRLTSKTCLAGLSASAELVYRAAMRIQHAEPDILPIPSVRPAVRHVVVLYLNEYTYRQTFFPPLVDFERNRPYLENGTR